MIGRVIDHFFGVDRWFFWKISVKSKLLRLRCVLLGGHRHVWTEMRGGGKGWDVLLCHRCHCHDAGYRPSAEVPHG